MSRIGGVLAALVIAVLGLISGHAGAATTADTSNRSLGGRGGAISVTAASRQFLAIVAAPNKAGMTFAQEAPTWAKLFSLTDAQAVAEAKPYASALRASDRRLQDDRWPRFADADVAALVAASERFGNDLGDLATMTVSRSSSWILSYDRDNNDQGLLAEIVRHDLGLPPAQPGSSPSTSDSDATHSLGAADKQYLAIIKPFYGAVTDLYSKEKGRTDATSNAEFLAAVQELNSALFSLQQGFCFDSWPKADEADIKKLVRASAPLLGDLEAIGDVEASTNASLSATFERDGRHFDTAAARVRQDLRLAPSQSVSV